MIFFLGGRSFPKTYKNSAHVLLYTWLKKEEGSPVIYESGGECRLYEAFNESIYIAKHALYDVGTVWEV